MERNIIGSFAMGCITKAIGKGNATKPKVSFQTKTGERDI
jgi:hypothetical protein